MQLIGSYLKTLVDQSQSPPSTDLQALCWTTDSLMSEERTKNVTFHFYHMKAAQASFCYPSHFIERNVEVHSGSGVEYAVVLDCALTHFAGSM